MSLMLSCSLSDSRVSSPPLLSANLAGAWPLGVREIGSDQRLTYCVFRDQRCAIRYRLCVQSDMGREKKKWLQASSKLLSINLWILGWAKIARWNRIQRQMVIRKWFTRPAARCSGWKHQKVFHKLSTDWIGSRIDGQEWRHWHGWGLGAQESFGESVFTLELRPPTT